MMNKIFILSALTAVAFSLPSLVIADIEHPSSVLTYERLEKMVTRKLLVKVYNISAEIIDACPPATCMIVSLGRASTLVDTFLRVRAKKMGISDYVYEVPYTELILAKAPDSKFYLNKIKPSEERLKGRDVVLFRNLYSGLTISFTINLITKTLSEVVPLKKVGTFFVADSDTVESAKKLIDYLNLGFGKPQIYVADNYLRRSLAIRAAQPNYEFKNPIEEYHRYNRISLLHEDPNEFTENPIYTELDNVIEKAFFGKQILAVPVKVQSILNKACRAVLNFY